MGVSVFSFSISLKEKPFFGANQSEADTYSWTSLMVKFLVMGRGNYSLWESKGLQKRKKKKKHLITWGRGEERSWIPLLGASLGSQLFQAELNLVDQHPVRSISVCQTLQLIPSSVPLSQQHTHSHSSVQTILCSSQWENLSAGTNYSSGYDGPSVHRKQRNRYTYADRDVSSISSSVTLWKSSCFSEAIYIIQVPRPPSLIYSSQGLQCRPKTNRKQL